MRILSLFGLGFLLLASSACDQLEYRPFAVGKEGEIVVVIDSTHWDGPLGDAVRDQIGPWVGTLPAPEPEFRLRQTTLRAGGTLDLIQKQKNIVFVAPLSDTTNVARFLRSRLDENAAEAVMNGQRVVVPRTDLWRKKQQVYYITAATTEDVITALEEKGADIRYAFNRMTRQRMQVDMFEKGRQVDIEDELLERFGFAVNVQHDYTIAIDTTNFVWLRRIISSESWRSLFIYSERANPADLTPEWIYETRNRLSEQYIQGNVVGYATIDFRRPLETENIDFLGRYGFETRGLWHMVAQDEDRLVPIGMGGPFLTYTFYDQDTGRIYMIDGMIFAPGYDKREFLRQMEVIAHTFRTRAEVNAAAETVQATD